MHLFANIRLSLQAPVLVLLYPSTAPLPQNTLQNHAPTWRKNHHFLHCFCIFHLYPEPYAQCLYTHLTQGKTPKIVQRKTSPTATQRVRKDTPMPLLGSALLNIDLCGCRCGRRHIRFLLYREKTTNCLYAS